MPVIDSGTLYAIDTPGLSFKGKAIASIGIDAFRKAYVYGRAVAYGVDRNTGEVTTSAEWSPTGGIPLTIGHGGQMVGRSVLIDESSQGLDVLWELERDDELRFAVADAISDGRDALSIGCRYIHGSSHVAVHEASLVYSPAFPGSEVRGFLTPEQFGVRPPGSDWQLARLGPYALDLELASHEATLPGRDFAIPALPAGRAQPQPEPRSARSSEQLLAELAGLEVRHAANGQHFLDMRCVPYDTPTMKVSQPEKIAAHAFSSIATANPSKIRLLEDHSADGRPVGAGQRFQDRADGLYATFRIYDTPQGRGALENASEGTYGGVSIGFRSQQEHNIGGLRVITKAQLHHVSLVNEPAYDDAQVLGIHD